MSVLLKKLLQSAKTASVLNNKFGSSSVKVKAIGSSVLSDKALKYISSGIVCSALLLLNRLGILEIIKNHGCLSKKDISNSGKSLIIEKAITELEINGVIKRENYEYSFSQFGECLYNYIGLIDYIYDGPVGKTAD